MLVALLATLAPLGCGGEDADVAGNYTIAVTSRQNGCELDNWMEGDTASGITATITQSGSAVTATLDGLVGAYYNAVFGSASFTGTVDGDDLELQIIGTRSATEGNCTYTFNAILNATIDGDTLTGTIDYQAATNDQPDCAALEGCTSTQDFNGTRPPT
jgi:hypothetical protein